MDQLSGNTDAEPAGRSQRGSIGRTVLAWAAFAGYVGLVEYWLGWTQLLAPWTTLDPAGVLSAVALFLLTYAVRAHRLYDYFREDMSGNWLSGLRLMIYHNALNNLLPMRTGELSFPLMMKRYFGIAYARSVPGLVWFRILDLHTIALIGGLALMAGNLPWLATAVVTAIWLAIPYLLFRASDGLRWRLRSRSGGRWASVLRSILDGLPASASLLGRSWVLSWVNWFVKLLVLAWVLGQFGGFELLPALIGAIGGELTSVLPFHAPGGVGTYEAGIVAGLAPFGVAPRLGLEAAVNAHLFVLGSALASAGLALLIPHRRAHTAKP